MAVPPLLFAAAVQLAPPHVFPPVDIFDAPLGAVGGGWLDGDHDGRDDLTVAVADPPSLRVYTEGPDAPPIDVPLTFAAGAATRVLIGAQPSGDPFVVVQLEGGGVAFATWTGTGFGAGADTPGTDVQLAGDVDGDGATDLWLGGSDNAVWLSSMGALSIAPPLSHDLPLWSAQAVGDVNNDGHDDLLLAYGDYLDGAPYRPLRGHAGLYRGTSTGLDETPLWELDGDDVSVADVFLGNAAVGLDGSGLVLTLTDINDGCVGGEWLAVLHDAGSASPTVHQIVEVPFADDCVANSLVVDLVPGRSKAVAAWSPAGVAWVKWEDVPGVLSMRADAQWQPADWLLGEPFAAGEQLGMLIDAVAGGAPAVALWSELPEDPDDPPPPPPPDDDPVDPEDTDSPVDEEEPSAESDDGGGCGCQPGSGFPAWLGWVAAAAVLRSRSRPAR